MITLTPISPPHDALPTLMARCIFIVMKNWLNLSLCSKRVHMTQAHKEVEIHLPLSRLVDTICNLPPEDLEEVRRQIEDRLQNPFSSEQYDPQERQFWESDLGREIIAEADPSISLPEVLKITSKIKGSLAAMISAERAER